MIETPPSAAAQALQRCAGVAAPRVMALGAIMLAGLYGGVPSMGSASVDSLAACFCDWLTAERPHNGIAA